MIEINLLPWREDQRRKQHQAQGLEVLLALLMAGLLLSGFHFALLNQIGRLQGRLSELGASLARVNKGLEEIKLLYQELDYQQLPSMDLGDMLKQERRVIDFLLDLNEMVPERLRLQEMQLDKGLWLLEGVATTAETVLIFSKRLKKGELRDSLKKEKNFKLSQKKGLYYFKIQLEPDL